jgi:hypothetical protein
VNSRFTALRHGHRRGSFSRATQVSPSPAYDRTYDRIATAWRKDQTAAASSYGRRGIY